MQRGIAPVWAGDHRRTTGEPKGNLKITGEQRGPQGNQRGSKAKMSANWGVSKLLREQEGNSKDHKGTASTTREQQGQAEGPQGKLHPPQEGNLRGTGK